MDRIQALLKEIKDDRIIMGVRNYSGSFLNNVADIFEKSGFGAAKVYLLDRMKSRESKQQADGIWELLRLFEKYQEIRLKRSIGRLIIKSLITLQSTEV